MIKLRSKKPLHTLLKEYRVLAILIVMYFAFMLNTMWEWFEIHHKDLTNQSGGVFGSLVLLIGGGIKFALEYALREHSGDVKNEPED